jgi:hypothetical protein
MRRTSAILAFAMAILSISSASAEQRMFIIANDADGYGVDRCLATAGACGAAIASAYCRSREFSQAVSYRKVGKDRITGTVPNDAWNVCPAGNCDAYVAIECTR